MHRRLTSAGWQTLGIHLSFGRRLDWRPAFDGVVSSPGNERFGFCRLTQLGLLRLLTAEAVIGEDVLRQVDAWGVYDRWLKDDRVAMLEEPPGLDRRFRARTRSRRASPKAWADAYLAAFAEQSQVTLVTFDRAFRRKVKPIVLLSE